MSISINYKYLVDGGFDYINYYRSDNHIDADNLPTPTMTGITKLSFSDVTAEKGRSYFVRLSSVRDGIEKVSDEIVVVAFIGYLNDFYNLNGLISYNSSMIFNADSINGGLTWGSTNIQDSAIIKIENSPVLKNFTCEFDYTRVSGDSNSSNFSLLFRTTQWGDNDSGKSAYAIYLNPNRIGISRGTNSSVSSEINIDSAPFTFIMNQKYRIKINANNGEYRVYVNDNLIANFGDSYFLNSGQFGFRTWTNGNMVAKIEKLVIYE